MISSYLFSNKILTVKPNRAYFRMNRIAGLWAGMPIAGKGVLVTSVISAGCFTASNIMSEFLV